MMNLPDIDIVHMEATLRARRREIAALGANAEERRAPVELDQTRTGRLSRMDALQQQAMAMDTARRRETELKRIDAALTRMAEGDYGYCARCGEAIGVKRLELDPATPICIDCARAAGGPKSSG